MQNMKNTQILMAAFSQTYLRYIYHLNLITNIHVLKHKIILDLKMDDLSNISIKMNKSDITEILESLVRQCFKAGREK